LLGTFLPSTSVPPAAVHAALAAFQHGDVGVAEFLQRGRGQRGAAAAFVVHGDRRVVPLHELRDLQLDHPARQGGRAGNVALVDFAGLAHVEQGAPGQGAGNNFLQRTDRRIDHGCQV